MDVEGVVDADSHKRSGAQALGGAAWRRTSAVAWALGGGSGSLGAEAWGACSGAAAWYGGAPRRRHGRSAAAAAQEGRRLSPEAGGSLEEM